MAPGAGKQFGSLGFGTKVDAVPARWSLGTVLRSSSSRKGAARPVSVCHTENHLLGHLLQFRHEADDAEEAEVETAALTNLILPSRLTRLKDVHSASRRSILLEA